MSEILFALLPMAILVISMGICKWPGDKSSLFTLIITILLAIFIFKAPVQEIGTTLLNSSYRACVTILSVIWIAVFSYNLLLHSGKIEILKGQLAAISTDKSVQVLLITWGFGGLLEGMAGYGTSVAIPAAILVTLGFRPLFAVLVSLIANSEPTTFGAVGIAETVLAEETGCPLPELCKATIQQLFPFIFLIPITLTILADRRRQPPARHSRRGSILSGPISHGQLPRTRNTGYHRQYMFHHCYYHLESLPSFRSEKFFHERVYRPTNLPSVEHIRVYHSLHPVGHPVPLQGNRFTLARGSFHRRANPRRENQKTTRTFRQNSRANPYHDHHGYRPRRDIRAHGDIRYDTTHGRHLDHPGW